ncbi:MAG: hypothetical protein KIT14_14225 [bacterium]|nr:hypothetical protein [bacterium]
MTRALAVLALLSVALIATAEAACPITQACNATALLANAQCCSAQQCVLDALITTTGPSCEMDFGTRHVVISGGLRIGPRTLVLRAGSVGVGAAVDGKGTGTAAGGRLTIHTTQQTTLSFLMDQNNARIDLSGPGGGGAFTLFADGAVDLTKGRIVAEGTGAGSSGGEIIVDANRGDVNVRIELQANGVGSGGLVRVEARDGGVGLRGSAGKLAARAGIIDVGARGLVRFEQPTTIDGAMGGSIDVTGGTLFGEGEIVATGGGSVDLLTTAGELRLQRNGAAITVDGEGLVSLAAETPGPEGTIVLAAPTQAQASEVTLSATGRVQVQKRINANGTSKDDTTGGVIAITSALHDVEIAGELLASDSAVAGEITLEAGRDVVVTENVVAAGLANADGGNDGGSISITALNAVRLVPTSGRRLDVSGTGVGGGGDIDIAAGGELRTGASMTLLASGGRNGGAGNVTLRAGVDDQPGDLLVQGPVTVTGATAAPPSRISLEGCGVTIDPGGRVDGSGNAQGRTEIVARRLVRVWGRLTSSGTQTAVRPMAGDQTGLRIEPGGVVTPALGACACPGGGTSAACCERVACAQGNAPAGCLVPCPTCGDGLTEWPETCDAGTGPRCGQDAWCSPQCRRQSCVDGFPCTDDTCDETSGCVFPLKQAGNTCDTGSACVTGKCDTNGLCQGSTLSCNDANACTVDTCDAQLGCKHTPLSCDDGNPCTADACNPATGCVHTNTTAVCDDGDVCTTGDRCGGGVCRPGTPLACAPGELCTPGSGCGPAPECEDDLDCRDQNACNGLETCSGGVCVPGAPIVCSDGDPCNGIEVCDPTSGACLPGTPCNDGDACNGEETCTAGGCEAGTPPVCQDADPCTEISCNPSVPGGCVGVLVPGCCSATRPCAAGACELATCVDGSCVVTPDPSCCTTASDCDDADPCTADLCDGDGRCAHTPLVGQIGGCGDLCEPATCVAGACTPAAPLDCDDADPCTDDFCDPETGCQHQARAGCCSGLANQCDDANACTTDTCDLDLNECRHAPEPTCTACASDVDCDPLGRCGGVACEGGVCVDVAPLACDDGNACTIDACPSAAGCTHTPRACDDGRACNGAELCDPTSGCVAGTMPNCDDGDLCTDDACDDVVGCTHEERTGFAAVHCKLDGFAAALAAAPAEAAAPKVRRKLGALVTKVRAALRAAEGTTKAGKRKKQLAKATKRVGALGRNVTRAQGRRLDPALATALARYADGASGAVRAVR